MYHMKKDTRQEKQGVQLGWSEEYVKQGWDWMFTEAYYVPGTCARRFYIFKVPGELREMSLEK